jgi:UDP-N-acetylmuramoylalanine--D-glutamate ligase
LKAKIYERTVVAAIYNDQDEETRLMVEGADVVEGCRAIGFTLNIPGRSMVGVVDDLIVDRAFIVERGTNAQELANTNDVQPFARHNLSNALAATALARAFGVPGAAVRDGLRNFVPAKHRISLVLEKEGIKYIDDSKATNAHAASQSLLSYESVIWIGGGDAKGQDLAEFVKQTSSRIKAAIVMGQDRRMIIDSLKGMNSVLPITEIIETNPEEAMRIAVEAAVSYASNGDVVLLAPGCASWDMFKDYGHRGDSFSEWVKKLV